MSSLSTEAKDVIADDVFAAGLVCQGNRSVRGVEGEKERKSSNESERGTSDRADGKSVIGFSRPRRTLA